MDVARASVFAGCDRAPTSITAGIFEVIRAFESACDRTEESDAKNRGEMVLVSTETDDRDMALAERSGTGTWTCAVSRWLMQCSDKDAVSANSSGSATRCSSSAQAGDLM
jgi:hypothetical protein